MYGAILGDIIGSPYEFAHWERNKKFDLPTSLILRKSIK